MEPKDSCSTNTTTGSTTTVFPAMSAERRRQRRQRWLGAIGLGGGDGGAANGAGNDVFDDDDFDDNLNEFDANGSRGNLGTGVDVDNQNNNNDDDDEEERKKRMLDVIAAASTTTTKTQENKEGLDDQMTPDHDKEEGTNSTAPTQSNGSKVLGTITGILGLSNTTTTNDDEPSSSSVSCPVSSPGSGPAWMNQIYQKNERTSTLSSRKRLDENESNTMTDKNAIENNSNKKQEKSYVSNGDAAAAANSDDVGHGGTTNGSKSVSTTATNTTLRVGKDGVVKNWIDENELPYVVGDGVSRHTVPRRKPVRKLPDPPPPKSPHRPSSKKKGGDGAEEDEEDDESPPPLHNLEVGDHVIRWSHIGYMYPIQIHGIVLEASRTTVTIADFGLTSNNTGGTSSNNASTSDASAAEQRDRDDAKAQLAKGEIVKREYEKQHADGKRLNIVILTTPSEMKTWRKVNYGETFTGGTSSKLDKMAKFLTKLGAMGGVGGGTDSKKTTPKSSANDLKSLNSCQQQQEREKSSTEPSSKSPRRRSMAELCSSHSSGSHGNDGGEQESESGLFSSIRRSRSSTADDVHHLEHMGLGLYDESASPAEDEAIKSKASEFDQALPKVPEVLENGTSDSATNDDGKVQLEGNTCTASSNENSNPAIDHKPEQSLTKEGDLLSQSPPHPSSAEQGAEPVRPPMVPRTTKPVGVDLQLAAKKSLGDRILPWRRFNKAQQDGYGNVKTDSYTSDSDAGSESGSTTNDTKRSNGRSNNKESQRQSKEHEGNDKAAGVGANNASTNTAAADAPKLPKSDPVKIVLARVYFLLEHDELEQQQRLKKEKEDSKAGDEKDDQQHKEKTSSIAGNNSAKQKTNKTFDEPVLPPYHVFYSNSECIAVWCKTGTWSTVQAAVFLHSTAIGNGKQMFLAISGVAAVQPWLIPAIAGFGVAYIGAPWLYLSQCQKKWEQATLSLTEKFWAWAPNEVFVEAITHWSQLVHPHPTTASGDAQQLQQQTKEIAAPAAVPPQKRSEKESVPLDKKTSPAIQMGDTKKCQEELKEPSPA